jgi:hypothetical protein
MISTQLNRSIGEHDAIMLEKWEETSLDFRFINSHEGRQDADSGLYRRIFETFFKTGNF